MGTCFNYTGTFCLNQEVLTGKGLKALNLFLYKIKNYCISPKILCQPFDAFVGSILSYSCEVWGFNKCKNIEKIHLKFLKLLLGVKKSTSSMAVYGETGRYPLYINRYERMVKYWGNVLKTDNIIMKTMYNDMLEKQKNGQKNWASQIKNILDMYGFSYVWNNQKTFDFKKTGYLIKNIIIDDFLQKWYSTVTSSSSLTMYKFFKPQLCYESYLDQLSVKNRKLLAKFRGRIHKNS